EDRAEELGVRLVDLDELLETADLISLHVPLTPETAGMLGEDEFKQMQDHAHIVNTTRGGIYEDAVLAQAVEEGWIGGAAIDVFEDEPNVLGNPLLDLEDDFMTPHIAGLTHDSANRIGSLMSESIINVMNGELPINILNPDCTEEDIPEENLSPSFQ
ncbi:MAG: NAD(P)-dependent oxidoreductase, partial [Halobacteriales archaeon]|nr:NAD(P)-dependent oxidoreductase [Halobacteriales archaeon]